MGRQHANGRRGPIATRQLALPKYDDKGCEQKPGAREKKSMSEIAGHIPVCFFNLVLRCLGFDTQGIVELGLLDHGDELCRRACSLAVVGASGSCCHGRFTVSDATNRL